MVYKKPRLAHAHVLFCIMGQSEGLGQIAERGVLVDRLVKPFANRVANAVGVVRRLWGSAFCLYLVFVGCLWATIFQNVCY